MALFSFRSRVSRPSVFASHLQTSAHERAGLDGIEQGDAQRRPSLLKRAVATLAGAVCLLAPVAASAQTTTTLSANPTTVAAGGVVTLTATLSTASAGQVNFCVAGAAACTDVNRVGRAQVMPNGTAIIRIRPSIGAHSYTATYTGTTTVAASSASSPAAVTVTGTYPTATTIANGGAVSGGYSVTGTVTSTTSTPVNPTGSISFQDTSNSNAVLATSTVASTNPPVLTGAGAALPVFTTAAQSSLIPAVADFNNDGYLDYAVVTSTGVSVYLQSASNPGTFTLAHSYTVTNATAIAANDFDRNGTIDLAVAGSSTSNNPQGFVTILLNSGTATFTTSSSVSTNGNAPNGLAVGDFNHDGLLDIAVSDGAVGQISVLLATAPGTFQTPLTAFATASGEVPAFIVAGDFNNDGITDFATESGGSTAQGSIFSGNALGTFAAVALPAISTTTTSGLVVADFNGDGKLDLALSNAFGSGLHVLVNTTANLGFAFTDNAITYTASGGTSSLAVANFATGLPSLIVANNGGGVYALTNTTTSGSGTVTFTNSPVGVTNQSTTSAILGAGDFNGDGITDAIANDGNTNPSTLNTFNYIATATATATVSPAGPANGSDNIVAAYAGDNNYVASTSSATSIPTTPIADGLTMYSNPASPIINGTPTRYRSILTINASSQGHTATGSVQFYMSPPSSSLNTCTGTFSAFGSPTQVQAFGTGGNTYTAATGILTTQPRGTSCYYAVYTDNSNNNYFANATTTTIQVVVNDTPTVTANLSQTPITLGQSVNLTANVVDGQTNVMDGSVAFTDGGSAINGCGSEPVSNGVSAACTYTPSTPGTHNINAIYTAAPSDFYTNALSAPNVLTVQAPPAIRVNPATVRQGSLAPIHIVVTGNYGSPTGTVTYTVNNGASQPIACVVTTALVCDGTYDTTSLPAGATYNVVATYSGDANYVAGNQTGSLTIVPDSYSAGSVAVGASSTTQTATLVFGNRYTLDSNPANAIVVSTQGAASVDFTQSGTQASGACTAGTTYFVGQSCTVNFTFSPTAPGLRSGAIKVYAAGATSPASIAYITGTGTAPLVGFAGGAQTVVTTNLTGTTANQIVADASGALYIADTAANRILKETPNGSGGYTEAAVAGLTLNAPQGVAVDGAGNLFIANTGANSIVEAVLNRDGSYTQTSVVTTGLSSPINVAVDGSGNLFVANSVANGTFLRETYNGTGYSATTVYTASGNETPLAVAVDAVGRVYTSTNTSVRRFDPSGSTYAAVNGIFSTNVYAGLAVDPAQTYYVARSNTGAVSRVQNTTIAGTVATLTSPHGITLDAAGNIYIVDSGNHRVVRVAVSTAPAITLPNTPVGGTSALAQSTLQNNGNVALTLSSLANNSTEIVVDSSLTTCSTSSTVAVGATCTIGFRLVPQTAGAKTATETLSDNSNNGTPATQQIQLSGTATQAPATLTIAVFDANNNNVSGASVVQGQTLTFRGTLTGAGVAPTGSMRFNFNASNPPEVCNPANGPDPNTKLQTCTATVSTAGLAPGTYNVYSRYSGDANYTDSTAVTTITIVASSNSGVGNTPVGQPSSTNGTATIVFTTAGTATAPTVTTLGSTVKDYQLVSTTCPTGAVTVGQSCTVTYSFTPTQAGRRPGAVAVYASNGTLLGIQYLNSIGQGAVANYQTTTPTFPYTGITTPQDIAFDGDGTAYITASGSAPGLTKITSGSSPTTTAITFPSGAGSFYGVAVDGAGRVFATADGGLYLIPRGATTAVAYAPTGAPALVSPRGIAIDSLGNIFVANSGASTPGIVEYPANGGTPFTYATGITGYGLAVDMTGNLYVVDTNTNTVQKLAPPASAGGTPTATPVQSATTFTGLRGVAVDLVGHVFVSANGSPSVYEIAANSTSSTAAIAVGAARSANMLHITPTGKLYVAEGVNNDIALLDRTISSLPAFPATMVGSTSAPIAATLENNGNAQLMPANFTVTPGSMTASTDFTVRINDGSSCANGAAPGALCRFRVYFTPQSSGLKTATVAFTSTVGQINSNALTVSGNGIQTNATVAVTNPANVISGSNISVMAAVTGSGVVPSGSVSFQIDGGAATTVAASSCTTSGMTETCTASLSTVGLSQGSHSILATFNGDANYVTATGSSTFNVTAGSYTTPSTAVGSGSGTRTAVLTFPNGGTVTSVNFLTQGNANGDFRAPSGGTSANDVPAACAAGTYAAGAACSVDYTFNPSRPGVIAGAITATTSNGIPLATAYLNGIGTGPESAFSGPVAALTTVATSAPGSGIAGDSAGNLFLADNATGNVYKETPNGQGGFNQSNPASVQGANGIALDGAGNLYVTSTSNTTSIYKLAAPNYNPALIPTDVPYPGHLAGIAADANGNLYAIDTNLNRILKFTVAGTSYNESVIATGASGVNYQGVSVDATGNLYVTGGNRVYKETFSQGSYTETPLVAANGAPGANFLSAPNAAGELYVPITGGLLKLTPAAGSTTSYTATTITGITGAQGTFIDRSGNVYTSTGSNGNVVMLDVSDAPNLTFANTPVNATSANQTITLENIGNTALTNYSSYVTPGSPDFVYQSTSTCTNNGQQTTGTNTGQTIPVAGSCNAVVALQPLNNGPFTEAMRFATNTLNNNQSSQRSLLFGGGIASTTTTGINTSATQGGSPTLTATVTLDAPSTKVAPGASPVGPVSVFQVTFAGPNGNQYFACTPNQSAKTCTATGQYPIGNTAPGTYTVSLSYPGDAYTASSTGSLQLTVTATSYQATQTPVGTGPDSFVTFSFPTTTTLNSNTPYAVYTQGVQGQDFRQVTTETSSCAAGQTYQAGSSCTVYYRFRAMAPGQRTGAITLFDNSSTAGAAVQSVYLSGVATGSLAQYPNPANAPVNIATGTGSPAFSGPVGPTVDAAGNVYVADGSQVLKIAADPTTHRTSATSTRTVVGSRFSNALSAAVDGLGNVFVVDYNNGGLLYEIVADHGAVSASSTTRILANLASIQGLAVDSQSNVYYSRDTSNTVYELTAQIIAASGTGDVSLSGTARANLPGGGQNTSPIALAVDSAFNLYVNDYNNGRILYCPASGTNCSTQVSGINHPNGVALDPAGDIYVADSSGNLLEYPVGSGTPITLQTGGSYSRLALDGAGRVYGAVSSGPSKGVQYIDLAAPAPLAFPSTAVGSSNSLPLTIGNSGNSNLTFTSFTTSDNNSPNPYTVNATGCNSGSATVAPGASCPTSVTFTPSSSSIGAQNGTLTIVDSSSNNYPAGTGTQTSTLTGTSTYTPSVTSQSTAVSYGTATGSFTITVTGTTAGGQPAGTVSLTTPNGAPAITSTQPITCAAGSATTCTATVNLNTSTAAGGTYNYGITFTPANGGNYNTATGSASFTVTAATPTVTGFVTPTSTAQGNTVTFTATVSGVNNNAANAPIGNVTFAVNGGTATAPAACSTSGASAGSCSATYTYTTAQGDNTGATNNSVVATFMPTDTNYNGGNSQAFTFTETP